MIFIIPIILGAAAAVTAIAGVGAGVDGVSNINEAKKRGKKAEEKYKKAEQYIQYQWQDVQQQVENYGLLQNKVKQETIGGFIDFMKKNGLLGSQKDRQYLAGLEGISIEQIEAYQAQAIEAEKFASGGMKALSAAGAAGQSAFMMATLFGTASTGTAISGLSGAALTNATLAWLGGGSLATGGGGMALGTIVLGGITVAPAIAIGGFVLANQGEKALTKVTEYEAKVNTEIAKIKGVQDFLQQVKSRTWELQDLVDRLNYRALELLRKLENKPFNPQQHKKEFQALALLIKALSEFMSVPILDNQGNLNPIATKIKANYSNI